MYDRNTLIAKLEEVQDDNSGFGECGESASNKAHFYASHLMELLPNIIAHLKSEEVSSDWRKLHENVQ